MFRLLVLLSLLFGASVVACAEVHGDETFGDWKSSCELTESDERLCHIYQRISLKDEHKTLLNLAVGYTPGEVQPVALFTLPLGVALGPGVAFKVENGESLRIPYTLCTSEGCRAALKLDAVTLQAMKMGLEATLTFATIESKAFNVPVSLNGFTKAINSLR